jgi:Alr-MurF fusion protein
MQYSAAAIAEIAGGRIHGTSAAEVRFVAYDTRRLSLPAQSLFVALHGSRNDGHRFIEDALQAGVKVFLVKQIPSEIPEGTAWIQVEDTQAALQTLAAAHRQQFRIPVAGITGSNGKTVVKEWLWQLLHGDFRIARSPRSFNSQLGVPLSVLGLEAGDTLALFEAGISKTGEMEKLQRIIRPNLGIFTHLGRAHDAGFADAAEKVAEKFRLFADCDVLVYCKDQEAVAAEAAKLKVRNPLLQTITWSRHDKATFRLDREEADAAGTVITVVHRTQELQFHIPFSDPASIENALTCLCALYALERLDPAHLERFSALQPVAMRLEAGEAWNGCKLINDAYSADPDSLSAALQFLQQQSAGLSRTLILSDFDEQRDADAAFYRALGVRLREHGIRKLIAVGPALSAAAAGFEIPELRCFESTSQLLEQWHGLRFEKEAILLKGGRRFRFERIARLLEKKVHTTRLEVYLDAILHNYRVYRETAGQATRFMAMVKAFAYGSGGQEVALLLQDHGVEYFAVAYPDEGVELRKAGVHRPIMVLNADVASLGMMVEYGLEPAVYSMELLRGLVLHPMAETLSVHIELDTGMHRLGFQEGDIDTLCAFLLKNPQVRVASVFSHLSASEEQQHDDFTRLQAGRFAAMADRIDAVNHATALRHMLNSAGIVRFPEFRMDMVRLGIGLYGVDPAAMVQAKLRPVACFKTVVSQVKTIAAGESVGYGRRALDEKPRRIAVIAAGYADGLRRELGNAVWKVRIGKHLVPIIGNVCMDMAMVDVSDIPCNTGDEVVLFGEEPTVEEMARACDTIPYEILTAVSQRVKRVFIAE